MRIHARLLLSQDIFSFEKKPVICGVTGGAGTPDGVATLGGVYTSKK